MLYHIHKQNDPNSYRDVDAFRITPAERIAITVGEQLKGKFPYASAIYEITVDTLGMHTKDDLRGYALTTRRRPRY